MPRSVPIRISPKLAKVPAKDFCRAALLSVQALGFEQSGQLDSVLVVFHEFPLLGTKQVEKLFQAGVYHKKGGYREVAIDRKTWKVEIQPGEGLK
ncbi:MAG: hypothetical protein IBJ03_03620 [Gemmatimonadaceae bacterium]|nr:hypothetical protein [Gemmatimonadaceae bacterium]